MKWRDEGTVDSRDFCFATCAADAPSFALKGSASISTRKSPATLRQRGKAREEAPEGARLLNAPKLWRKQVIRWKSTESARVAVKENIHQLGFSREVFGGARHKSQIEGLPRVIRRRMRAVGAFGDE